MEHIKNAIIRKNKEKKSQKSYKNQSDITWENKNWGIQSPAGDISTTSYNAEAVLQIDKLLIL